MQLLRIGGCDGRCTRVHDADVDEVAGMRCCEPDVGAAVSLLRIGLAVSWVVLGDRGFDFYEHACRFCEFAEHVGDVVVAFGLALHDAR